MLYIVSLNYIGELSEVDKYLNEHKVFLDKFYQQGHFIVSGRKEPRTGGIILVTATSQEAVEAIIKQDPFYQAKVADYQITAFVPTMAAEQFSTLTSLA